ncbi:TonB-dependent receptor [Bacteroides gallinaceum]|uniref:SusC/RagA family TonB-linked outer membrane protein n=1 Tax=Bacteroides gallinaceum TaxID=1462571 RepID=UPI0025A4B37C|nr:TonB-dependent receptor [Bacteroides gallinaceum]MDM8153459.1 TonB-dependent receptor [Bacteroides gallinaceum]
MNKLLSICFVLLLGVNQIVAQDIQVNGTVLGIDNQEPVIGATVLVVGSKTGTVTDMDGKFSLKVPAGATLQVSFIGMRMEKIKAKPEMLIYLHPDSELLEEVVVTGYGNVSKSSYTGAASILSTEKQRDLPVISVTQMMEANLPGVSLSSASGTPGSNTSIRIRGIGSISGSNEPLYVLDGVPVQSGNMSPNDMNTGGLGILNTLNPADIENITILKDAASSSLYGARGANGVVLITTKKGKEGKTTYNVKASFGISDLAYQFRPTMGGDERRELIWEGLRNSMMDMGSSMEEASRYADSQIDVYAPKPANGYADWDDALFRKAQQQNYDFSLRGGSENTRFAGSVNYTKQENVAYNSGFERYSGHLNFNNKFKKFDVGMNALFSLTKEKPLPGGTYYSNPMYALKTALNPSIPIYNEDGSYNTDITSINNMNPVYENEINQHKSQVARTFASIEAGYTIIEGLRLSTVFNVDYTHTKDFRYFSPESSDGKSPNGQGDIYSIENLTYNSNTRLNYTHTFGDHSIDVLAAYEIQRWDREYMASEAKNYSTGKKNVLDNASTPVYIGHNVSGDAMLSYVLRANYDYKKRYYVSVSFRRDGSSRLDPSNRWDNFWAVSASWRLSQEKFMKPLESWLSDAKLRVSYGVNGNIPGNLYDYYGLYDMSYSYNDQPAMVESNLANPDLSWEKNYALNVGVDFFLFSRLNLSVDWYVRNTKDLLLSRSVNPVTGFSSITDNIGKMRNKGVEIELSSTNIDRNDFLWTTAFNLSHNKNEVIKLADVSEYYTDSYYIVKEGYSLGTIALREYAGVDPENGKPMYYSNVLVDGERSREIVYDPNEAVSVPLANIYPKVSGGLTNTFRYKMFDLSFNLSYSLGGHSYDSGMWAIQDDGYSSYAPKSVELRRRWQKPGDITDVPRYVNGQEFGGYWHSSRGIHSTDHLRLKSLILGVNAPRKWLNPVGLSMARIYFSGTNLLTWAKYDQYDPELQGTVGFDIPPLKTFSVGLEVEF